MLHRELLEKEMISNELFVDTTRALYRDGRWAELFQPRTIEDFQAYISEHPVPEDPIIQNIFQNNVSPAADEELLFQNAFDIFVFSSMHYNLGCIHYHNYFELTYLAKGHCTQIINGQEIDTQVGDFIILAPGISHYVQLLDEDSIVISVAIRKSTFQEVFFGLFIGQDILSNFFEKALNAQCASQYLMFQAGNDTNVMDRLYDMYYECAHPIAYSRQALNNKMSDLFIYLLRYHKEKIITGSDSHRSSSLLPVLQYIQHHYTTVTLNELSERFHYHPAYIGKALKEETGQSFNELRQSLRLNRAAFLLEHTDTSLQQIAMELRYSDLSHFHRNFKAHFGVTPSQYRKSFETQQGSSGRK